MLTLAPHDSKLFPPCNVTCKKYSTFIDLSGRHNSFHMKFSKSNIEQQFKLIHYRVEGVISISYIHNLLVMLKNIHRTRRYNAVFLISLSISPNIFNLLAHFKPQGFLPQWRNAVFDRKYDGNTDICT